MVTVFTLALLVAGVLLLLAAWREHPSATARGGRLTGQPVGRALLGSLLAFGGTGAVLVLATGVTDSTRLLVGALVAGLVGGGAGALSARERTQPLPNATVGHDGLVGLTATVIAPLSAHGTGRIAVRRGEATLELAARPGVHNSISPDRWRSVVIVEMRDETALVAPVDRD